MNECNICGRKTTDIMIRIENKRIMMFFNGMEHSYPNYERFKEELEAELEEQMKWY